MLKAAVLARGLSSFTTKDFVKLFQKEEANAEREKESKYRIRNTDVQLQKVEGCGAFEIRYFTRRGGLRIHVRGYDQ